MATNATKSTPTYQKLLKEQEGSPGTPKSKRRNKRRQKKGKKQPFLKDFPEKEPSSNNIQLPSTSPATHDLLNQLQQLKQKQSNLESTVKKQQLTLLKMQTIDLDKDDEMQDLEDEMQDLEDEPKQIKHHTHFTAFDKLLLTFHHTFPYGQYLGLFGYGIEWFLEFSTMNHRLHHLLHKYHHRIGLIAITMVLIGHYSEQ